MKIETNTLSPAQTIPGTEKGTSATGGSRLMADKSVTQGETVTNQTPVDNGSGAPEIPPPSETTPVGLSGFGEGQSVDFQQLLMWIANMAAEYIKQQSELLQTRQKAVESGYSASIDAAKQNFTKNLVQAIIGIVGSSIAIAGAGIAGFKLGVAGKELKNLSGTSKATGTGVDVKTALTPDQAKMKIEQLTGVGQTWNAAAGSLSQGIQGFGGAAAAFLELDAKKQEALSQLIAKTAESISSNEASSRQIIEKFANELIAMLKNFYASTTR
jgi:hypothetical protein